MEDRVSQDAGVVDDAVDAAECVDARPDDRAGAHFLGDAVEIGDRLAAADANRLDHFLRRRSAGAVAGRTATEIIDDDGRPFRRRQQGNLASDPAARPSDDDYLAVQRLCITHPASLPGRELAPAHGKIDIRDGSRQRNMISFTEMRGAARGIAYP